jgi:hypothetical protein
VSYDEPARARLTANRVTYYTADERIVAEGNVVVTLPTGTTMTGPSAEYLRDAPPLRLASRLTAPGRPTVRIVGGARGPARSGARPAGRADTSITTIVANTVIDEADSVVYASGQSTSRAPTSWRTPTPPCSSRTASGRASSATRASAARAAARSR